MQHNWTNVPPLCNLKYFSCPHYEFVIHNVLLLCAIMYHTHNEFVVVSTLVFAPWVSCNNFAPGAVWHRTSHHNGKSSMDCCMVLFQSWLQWLWSKKYAAKLPANEVIFCVAHDNKFGMLLLFGDNPAATTTTQPAAGRNLFLWHTWVASTLPSGLLTKPSIE